MDTNASDSKLSGAESGSDSSARRRKRNGRARRRAKKRAEKVYGSGDKLESSLTNIVGLTAALAGAKVRFEACHRRRFTFLRRKALW